MHHDNTHEEAIKGSTKLELVTLQNPLGSLKLNV